MKALQAKIDMKKIFLKNQILEYEKLIGMADQYPESNRMKEYYIASAVRCKHSVEKMEREIDLLKHEARTKSFFKYMPKSAIEYRENSQ